MKKTIILSIALLLLAGTVSASTCYNCSSGNVWNFTAKNPNYISHYKWVSNKLGWDYKSYKGCVAGKWEIAGGSSASFVNFLPKVVSLEVKDNQVSWLTSKAMEGKLICSTESIPFALDTYGHAYTRYPQGFFGGALEQDNFGYNIVSEQDQIVFGKEGQRIEKEVTYHTVSIPKTEEKTLYCRTWNKNALSGGAVLSREFKIER